MPETNELPELKPCPFCGGVAVYEIDGASCKSFACCGDPDCFMSEPLIPILVKVWNTRTPLKVKQMKWINCKGGEKAETIFGDVILSFDASTVDGEWEQDIQADMPWGDCEVFSNMGDVEDWVMDKLEARILSALE